MDLLAPSRAEIDHLATMFLTIPPADRVAAEQLVYIETYNDLRSTYPAMRGHEIAYVTVEIMKALKERVAEMIAHGAEGGGHA